MSVGVGCTPPRRDPWTRTCDVAIGALATAVLEYEETMRGMLTRITLAREISAELGRDDAEALSMAEKLLHYWAAGNGAVSPAAREASRAALAEGTRSRIVPSVTGRLPTAHARTRSAPPKRWRIIPSTTSPRRSP